MNEEDFNNGIKAIDNKINEQTKKELSVIDDRFEHAKELFTKIYDEYINSDGFKKICCKRAPDFSLDRKKFDMKIELLKDYLKVSRFPSDWYYHDECKS